MNAEKIAVFAKMDRVSKVLKRKIYRTIKKSRVARDTKFLIMDGETSYLVSSQMVSVDTLVVSVCDHGPSPNASILPYLRGLLGEPTTMHSKPWILDPSHTFFIMMWKNPDLSKMV